MSLRSWIFLCSALTLLAQSSVQLAQPVIAANDVDPRASVAIKLVIDAANCKERLGDELPRIKQEIYRSLLHSLEQFGFLHIEPDAKDIVTFRIMQREERPQHVLLEVSAEGPGINNPKPVSFEFEKWMQRHDWRPDVVSREWSELLDNLLERKRNDLISNVLGLPPLNTNVELEIEPELHIVQAHLQLLPALIGAAQDPRSPKPKFRVSVIVRDLHVAIPTVDNADLILGRCSFHALDKTYVCVVESVIYQDTHLSVSERWQLLQRATIKTTSVHMLEYWPNPHPRAQGAIMVSRTSPQP